MASNIPRAREILRRAIDITTERDVKVAMVSALMLMTRKVSRKAPVKSAPLSPEKRQEIVALRRADPTLHLSEIAHRVGVNPGRVSEVLSQPLNRP
jgi:hypothetical protein